jgi:UDP-glucose 4-epimerase
VLLEAAAGARVQAYVRTSRFQCVVGVPGSRARWIDEDAAVLPGDAGAAARVALESYCELFARHHRMPCTLLRIAGLLDEPDGATVDAPARGGRRIDELLHRRVDLEDAVSAHVLALHAQRQESSRRYLIAATTPFSRDDVAALAVDAPAVVARRVPEYADVYRRRGWRISPTIDYVLDNARARRELGWQPRYDFRTAIARLAQGEPPGSLARLSGDVRPGGRAPGGVAA